jgi:hypothetical protein
MSSTEQARTEMIRELLAGGIEREVIVDRVVEVLDDAARLEIVRTHVRTEVARSIRVESKSAAIGGDDRTPPARVIRERQEFISHVSAWKPTETADDVGERVSRRTALLATTFMVPGHGFVLWGEATETQHSIRAAALEKLGATVFESAHLHRRAISEIRAAKVTTLNQIVEQ